MTESLFMLMQSTTRRDAYMNFKIGANATNTKKI